MSGGGGGGDDGGDGGGDDDDDDDDDVDCIGDDDVVRSWWWDDYCIGLMRTIQQMIQIYSINIDNNMESLPDVSVISSIIEEYSCLYFFSRCRYAAD